jgi:hypothetical protein
LGEPTHDLFDAIAESEDQIPDLVRQADAAKKHNQFMKGK